MDEMLGLDIGPSHLRAAVVTPDGFASPIVRIEATDDHPSAARQSVQQLGAPSDMWAVIAVRPAPAQRRSGASRMGDPSIHGVSAHRLSSVLNRPVIVHYEEDIAAAGEAWFGAGLGHRKVAALRVGHEPTWTLVLHGQVASSAGRSLVSAPSPTQLHGDVNAMTRISAHLAMAIIEEHRPDVLIVDGRSRGLSERTALRVAELQSRQGATVPECHISIPQLGSDGALRGCAIWPTASGSFGGQPRVARTVG